MAVGVAVVLAMAVVLLLAERDATEQSRQALATRRVAASYRDARIGLAQEEALERDYLLERHFSSRLAHAAAGRDVVAALRHTPHPETLLHKHAAYATAARRVFAAAAAGRTHELEELDEEVA